MDLGAGVGVVGVVGVCRVGVDTPFFSAWGCILTCKVNSRCALTGDSDLETKE